jgi:hypothetical protein
MTRKAPAAVPSIGDLIDQYGALALEIKADQATQERLRDTILEMAEAVGNDAPEGELFRALVVRSERSIFDVKAAKAALGPKKVGMLTTTASSVSLRVTPRQDVLLDKLAA